MRVATTAAKVALILYGAIGGLIGIASGHTARERMRYGAEWPKLVLASGNASRRRPR